MRRGNGFSFQSKSRLCHCVLKINSAMGAYVEQMAFVTVDYRTFHTCLDSVKGLPQDEEDSLAHSSTGRQPSSDPQSLSSAIIAQIGYVLVDFVSHYCRAN
jgi:hypothetical protein